MVRPTISLEMNFGGAILDAEGKAILDAEGNAILDRGWADVITDTRAPGFPIHIRRGNFGLTQLDRVGDVGTMTFALDNSEANSSEQVGVYSPSNDYGRYAFGEETKTRLKLSYNGNERYKFKGIRLDKIDPDSGTLRRRATAVTAVDWFDEAFSTPAKGLEVELAKRDDQLLDLLVAAMENSPETDDFDIGADQYGAAFHDIRSESTTIATVLQSIALSGLGTIFVNCSDTYAEILRYRSRHNLLSSTTPVASLDNSMVDLQAPRVARNRVRKVLVTTHPLRIDAAATSEIFVLNQELVIPAGETITFTGRYIDPNQNAVRICADEQVTPLVADTHYKFSSVSGSGNDLNGDLAITATHYADYTAFSCTNNAGVTGYLWFLKILGKGVYLYDEIEHMEEDTSIKKGETLYFDMIYQDDFDIGKYAAESMLDWESDEENERVVVHFKANRNADLMDAAIDVEPGDLVEITEDVTGIDRKFFANGVELVIGDAGYDIDVYWYCIPAQEGQLFCILDAVGYAELDLSAILAW